MLDYVLATGRRGRCYREEGEDATGRGGGGEGEVLQGGGVLVDRAEPL